MVRHGRTALNESGELRAWEDVPLDQEGQIDARIAAQKIAQYNPQMLYHSDLIRDTMTGNIIGEYLRIPSEPDYNLRTSDMGQWTGMQDTEVVDGVREWYMNPWKDAPGGESYNRFTRRFFDAFDGKLETSKIEAFNPTVVVAHGRNFAALYSRYTGVEPWKALMPMPGGIALIRDNGYGFPPYTIEFITETEEVLVDL